MSRSTRALVVCGVAAAVTVAVRAAAAAGRLPGGSRRWQRLNHRGDRVTLTEGVALTCGAGLPLLVVDPPAGLAVVLCGVAGAADDLGGRTDVKGLRGHLQALRAGELTTGALKIALLGGAGLAAAVWSDHRAGRRLAGGTLAGAAIVAGSANLANLFDLRPGRALKVALTAAVPMAPVRPAAAALLGAGAVLLRDDLRGLSMLGDTGANALGAGLGVGATQALCDRDRWVLVAGISGLTLLSERVSFSQVIDATPALRALDRWGRG